jgi:L-ascorbate metabolism protein UlaG (beta-lactamase superfamily)
MNHLRLFLIIGVLSMVSHEIASQEADEIATADGVLTVHPVLHGSFVLTYNDLTLFIDPYGGSERYEKFGNPDLILLTDIHGDHLHQKTLDGLNTEQSLFVGPRAVFDSMTDTQRTQTTILNNGQGVHRLGIFIQAVPMYNLPETADSRHPKGRGNGYLLTFADTLIYISGDTEDIPEMRMLNDIDVAFICMNLPYTMSVDQAASAVLEFEPKVVYPYHYRGSDVNAFKTTVGNSNPNIEVRLRDWYPEN